MTPTERADRIEQLKIELAAAEKGRDFYNQAADEARDQSYEEQAPQARDAYMGHSTRLRATAISLSQRVFELNKEIAKLQASAPVVLTAEQCADIDDTMNAQVAA